MRVQTTTRMVKGLFMLIMSLCIATFPALPQQSGPYYTILGYVYFEGNAVPNAFVEVKNTNTGEVRTGYTDTTGLYVITLGGPSSGEANATFYNITDGDEIIISVNAGGGRTGREVVHADLGPDAPAYKWVNVTVAEAYTPTHDNQGIKIPYWPVLLIVSSAGIGILFWYWREHHT